MESLWIAMIAAILILLASVVSIEAGISVALIEITMGVIAGNVLGLTSPPWMDFLASFASILLTFLAGAEVDHQVLRERLKESLLIGGVSFLAPFLGAWAFSAWALGWAGPAAQIAGVALSTTSLAALLVLMFFAERAQSHAVLPAFVLGLALAPIFHRHRELGRRFRVVAFALLTPFFFLKGGLNVSLGLVWANFGLLVLLLLAKQVTKFVGVYPFARRYVPGDAMFLTLLMSTGLTFGTISSLYGLNAGILTRAQFSVLVTAVVASAVIPTLIAQRWFSPEMGEERPVTAAIEAAPE